MGSTLTVRLVSPVTEVFKGEVAGLVAPAWDGMVGILPRHAPFIALLGNGKLDLDLPGGGSESFHVAGGVLKVEADEVTILSEYAGEAPPEMLPPEADFHPDDLVADTEIATPADPLV